MASGGNVKDQILDLGVTLLKEFIYKWIQRHSGDSTVLTREQLGAVELQNPQHRRISDCMQQIGDEVDGFSGFNELVNTTSTTNLTQEAFMKMVLTVFSDGKITWSRVVLVFCFTCRLVFKAYEGRIFEFISSIISWTRDFLREHVVNWILEQGGWEGIYSQFSTPTLQMACVFLAGVVTALLVMRQGR